MKYFQITENRNLPDIDQYAPFKAVIVSEEPVDPARQNEISGWLIESGMKYAMVCGEDCQSWADSIRQANLEKVSIDNMQPEEFVMITRHQHERLRQVFWHAKKHARHTHVELNNTLVIHLGSQDRSLEYISIFDKA